MSDENKINDGGPAFPQSYLPELLINSLTEEQIITLALALRGMSLRDWFAGQALAGQSTVPDNCTCPTDRMKDVEAWRAEGRATDAKWCFDMADAMIAARKAKP